MNGSQWPGGGHDDVVTGTGADGDAGAGDGAGGGTGAGEEDYC